MSTTPSRSRKHGRRDYPKLKRPRVPADSKFRVNLRFLKEEHVLVKAAAAKTEQSMNLFITSAAVNLARSIAAG